MIVSGSNVNLFFCNNQLLGRNRQPRCYLETSKRRPPVPISIEGEPEILEDDPQILIFGYEPPGEKIFQETRNYILKHKEAILQHWYGEIDSAELLRGLKLLDKE